jgi:hypothetical protein
MTENTTAVRILWTHDNFNGPVNGLCSLSGRETPLWFVRLTEHSQNVNSTVDAPDLTKNDNEDKASSLSSDSGHSWSSEEQEITKSDEKSNSDERAYALYNLRNLDDVQLMHERYCSKTGAPLLHGDPVKIKRNRQLVKKIDYSQFKEGEEIEGEKRALCRLTQFDYEFDPMSVEIGEELVCIVKESQFENYNIPRRVEWI